MDMFQSKEI